MFQTSGFALFDDAPAVFGGCSEEGVSALSSDGERCDLVTQMYCRFSSYFYAAMQKLLKN